MVKIPIRICNLEYICNLILQELSSDKIGKHFINSAIFSLVQSNDIVKKILLGLYW